MNTKSHIGFWLSLFVVLFLLNPLFRDGPSMQTYVEQEVSMTRSTFGDKTGSWIQDKAGVVFEILPSESLQRSLIRSRGMELSRQVGSAPGVAMAKTFNSYVQGLILNLFVLALRFFIFLVWFLVLSPVFIAAIVDGFAQRAIKRWEFGEIKPAAYSVMSMIVIPMMMAPLFYLVVPMSISPLVSPLWALLAVLPLSLLVSNMQPIFGRR